MPPSSQPGQGLSATTVNLPPPIKPMVGRETCTHRTPQNAFLSRSRELPPLVPMAAPWRSWISRCLMRRCCFLGACGPAARAWELPEHPPRLGSASRPLRGEPQKRVPMQAQEENFGVAHLGGAPASFSAVGRGRGGGAGGLEAGTEAPEPWSLVFQALVRGVCRDQTGSAKR